MKSFFSTGYLQKERDDLRPLGAGRFDVDRIRFRLRDDFRRLRAPKGYLRAGLPHFPGLFGRDSIISAWQTLEEDSSIARATLMRLASLQGKKFNLRREEEPGKILHEYYERTQIAARWKKREVVFFWGSPYYGSIDATPLWLILLQMYLKKSGDFSFRDLLWPNACAAYRWIVKIADHNRDGFLDYEPHNRQALRHHSWKDSDEFGKVLFPVAPIEAQGYAYAALKAFALLAEEKGEHSSASDAQERAGELRSRFRQRFLSGRFCAFAIDGEGTALQRITSNPGHLLFTGILDEAESQRIARRLFEPDLWTRYGLRTLSVEDSLFDYRSYHRGSVWPHDNWFFWIGLRAIGDEIGAERVKAALGLAYGDLGGFLPELYAVDPKTEKLSLDIITQHGRQRPGYPQAWASGALLAMLHKSDF